MKEKNIDWIELQRSIFESYMDVEICAYYIREKNYVCYCLEFDYNEFLNQVWDECRNEELPFVLEYAHGFTDGYNSFENNDKNETRRIVDDFQTRFLSSFNFHDLQTIWANGEEPNFLNRLYNGGKQAGVYYKALKYVVEHPDEFNGINNDGNKERAQSLSIKEDAIPFNKEDIQKYCQFNRKNNDYMMNYLDELEAEFNLGSPKTEKQIFGAICLILFKKEENDKPLFNKIKDFNQLIKLLAQYWKFVPPKDMRPNKYKSKADELKGKHSILDRKLL